MADIVRNAEANKEEPPAEQNEEHIKRTTKKEVEFDKVKEKNKKIVTVTIDNYMRTQMNLLYAINTNLVTIIKQLKEIKDKR